MSDTADKFGGATADAPHRGFITVCLMIATLMQALDTTVANVALPYMQGTLSASYDQITWVLTSYVISAAIFTAPVGWLTARFGRKNLFLTCLIGFTLTSMMCGVATSLPEMVTDRFLQGMFGSALVPLSQSTMLDIYPAEKRGMAMSVWGMGVMVGPILGPTLGGYLTYYYNWRFVFFINLPFGILAVLGLLFFMPRVQAGKDMRFDWLGFFILCIGLAALQIMLDRGEELDWFSSKEIVVSAVLAALGLYLFVVHLVTAKNPFIPRAAFADRNFNAGLITMFSVGIVLIASSSLMAPYLENLSNYPVATAGLIMSPRGIGTMVAMLIAGQLSARMDPRILMFFGYFLLGLSLYLLEGWTPDVSKGYMSMTIIIQGAGLGFIFVPLQVVAFYTMSPALRTQGSSLLNLMRNVGSAIGVSVTSALLDHQSQYEHAVLAQYITPFTRTFQPGTTARQMLNPVTPGGASLLNSLINVQSQIIGYIDDYKFMLLSAVPAMLCLFFMRKPPKTIRQ
jgi:DHA2 family multidrug resistance protein